MNTERHDDAGARGSELDALALAALRDWYAAAPTLAEDAATRVARARRELGHVLRAELARHARRAVRVRTRRGAGVVHAFRRRVAASVADARASGLRVPNVVRALARDAPRDWPSDEALAACARALERRA